MPRFEAGQKGEQKMNKTIWALAFVVLCSGMAFAIANASATQESTSKWQGVTTAGNIVTEGGNVTSVTLDVNTSTEKWAGAYGEIDGNLVLAEDSASAFMYSWAYADGDVGEVCVSQNNNPTWANLGGGVLSTAIDTVWEFTPGDADSAASVFTEDGVVNIAGTAYTSNASTSDVNSWQTVILNFGATTTPDDVAFCVNITQKNNYVGDPVDFQLIAAANETAGITQDYYFYVELV